MSSACSLWADHDTDPPEEVRLGMKRASRVRIVSGRSPGWREVITAINCLPKTRRVGRQTQPRPTKGRSPPGRCARAAPTSAYERESNEDDRVVTADRVSPARIH